MMIVTVILEARFHRTPDGKIWTQAGCSYSFWQRYLVVFDGVRVVARVRDVPELPPRHVRADGTGVSFAAVPHYLGPLQYLCKARSVRRAVREALEPEDAVIMRVGSLLANCLNPVLRQTGRPYGVEVVGDPWDVFAPGVVRHPLRPLFRWHFARQLRIQCVNACAAAYVTEHTLQRRYPVGDGCFRIAYSSVDLEDGAFETSSARVSGVGLSSHHAQAAARDGMSKESVFQLVLVGSLAQMYKAPDMVLKAMATCVKEGLNLRLTIVGDGRFRPRLEQQVLRLGLKDRVVFRGQILAGEAVREELDKADLFVLPSRTEGLPRAMIEAMARGLPCIGSTAGGIPELLPAEDLVAPGDAAALAQKIREVLTDPGRMRRMSSRNLERAQDFREDRLRERRNAFYRFVRQQTEQWLQKR